MAVSVSRIDNPEQRILWGMLSDKRLLAEVAPHYKAGLFGSREAGLVGTWACQFWGAYHRAPGREIVAAYDGWAASAEPDIVALVGRLLQTLFDRWEDAPAMNTDVLTDEARSLFKKNALVDLAARITGEIEAGHVDRADSVAAGYRPLEVGLGEDVALLGDEARWDAMWDTAAPLIEFPAGSALANFFGEALCADSFVSFLGKEKIGKSWWLQWLAWEAAVQGRNVLYVEAGDSSEGQVRERFAPHIMGRPLKAGRFTVPTGIELLDRKRADVAGRSATFPTAVEPDLLRIAVRRLYRSWGGDRIHLYCQPSGTVTVSRIDSLLRAKAQRGVHIPVVVIDYADLLAAENPKLDVRDQINETWRALRALSQRWHCLVVTATQARREAYDEWVLTRKDITEDKRKLSHVNYMIGINQTGWEKESGLYRLNVPCGRKLTFGETTCLWCAGNLSYSQPAVVTTF